VQRAERLLRALQKLVGYTLTGDVREKLIVLIYGPKDCGKSTFLMLWRALLGPHATILSPSTFSQRSRDNATEENIASLHGARLAITSEWQRGEQINEARLKALTSGVVGARISVVPKYQKKWDFEETHKLWIDSNFLPKASGSDDAFWARVWPIHCPLSVPENEIDKELMAKLLKEGDAIIRWALHGELLRQSEGLKEPVDVQIERDEWRSQSNPILQFIHEECVRTEQGCTPVTELHMHYLQWLSDRDSDDSIDRRQLNAFIEELGFKRQARQIEGKSTKCWIGIQLSPPQLETKIDESSLQLRFGPR
jgi:putative DNA primase/helicase